MYSVCMHFVRGELGVLGYPKWLGEQLLMSALSCLCLLRNKFIYITKSDLLYSLMFLHYLLLILQEAKLHEHTVCACVYLYPVIHTRVVVFHT